MPTSLSPVEILVILVVGLIVLGPNRLPEAGRQVGRALSEVRRWSRGIQAEIRDALDTEMEPPRVSTEPVTSEATRSVAATDPRPESPTQGSEPVAPANGAAPADEPPRQ